MAWTQTFKQCQNSILRIYSAYEAECRPATGHADHGIDPHLKAMSKQHPAYNSAYEAQCRPATGHADPVLSTQSQPVRHNSMTHAQVRGVLLNNSTQPSELPMHAASSP